MHLTKYYVSTSVGIKLVISMRVCNLPNCVVEIQQLKRITTFVLCIQSPLYLHQFCLTRFQIELWLELIGTPSVDILHRSDCTWLCCILCQLLLKLQCKQYWVQIVKSKKKDGSLVKFSKKQMTVELSKIECVMWAVKVADFIYILTYWLHSN